MQYANIKTGRAPMSETDVRVELENVSLPEVFTCPDGYAEITETDYPAYNGLLQGVVTTYAETNGVWASVHTVVDLSVEDANANIKAKIAQIESGQARAVRECALTGDKTFLQKTDNQITRLRAQLK